MERQLRDLINTEKRTILCPRCEEEQPMRDFATLGMSPLYAENLTPIYRCKLCNHLFAPRPVSETAVAAGVTKSSGNGASH
jgi:rubredoxin